MQRGRSEGQTSGHSSQKGRLLEVSGRPLEGLAGFSLEYVLHGAGCKSCHPTVEPEIPKQHTTRYAEIPIDVKRVEFNAEMYM
jgi:hypothetical protein